MGQGFFWQMTHMTYQRLFGTDGIRAHIDASVLKPESVTKLGRILGAFLAWQNKPPLVLIGKDTRESGFPLEQALANGLIAAGVDCLSVGVIPTSGVAFLAKERRASLGIMISASHNPYHDNGFKIFDGFGNKLSADCEAWIERVYFEQSVTTLPTNTGSYHTDLIASKLYQEMLGNYAAPRKPPFPKFVVDCANGSASFVAQEIFSDAIVIAAEPDGKNINDGVGSEHPESLANAVKKSGANIGFAFDGDADRIIVVDENGNWIDGDAVLALLAIDLKQRGLLKKNRIVATIMSGVALDNALLPHGITVVRSDVGDKLVAQKILDEGLNFGGENSGHIMCFPETTTGDGIFCALWLLRILQAQNKKASELFQFFKPSPRILRNINVEKKIPLSLLPKTTAAINQASVDLNGSGRVMLRYSGTEMKARLLVESPTPETCQKIAEEISGLFCRELDAFL